MYLLASFVKWASLPLWYLWAGLNDKSDIDLDITLFFLLRLHLLCLIMTIDSNGKNVLKKHHHVSPLFSKWSRITLHHQKKASDRPGKVGQQRGLEEIRFLSNISVLPFFRDRRLPDHKD